MEEKKAISKIVDIGVSAGSALVGFAIGGPVGAVVGGAIPPAVQMAKSLFDEYKVRQSKRLSSIVNKAFENSELTDEQILERLKINPQLTDEIIRMIRQMEGTSTELDAVFSVILCNAISKDDYESRRSIVLFDSIKGMNKVQIELLGLIYEAGGKLSAEDIANKLCISEIELRYTVRDLELRGMIKDNDDVPLIWQLRELGMSIAKMYHETKKGDNRNEVF